MADSLSKSYANQHGSNTSIVVSDLFWSWHRWIEGPLGSLSYPGMLQSIGPIGNHLLQIVTVQRQLQMGLKRALTISSDIGL